MARIKRDYYIIKNHLKTSVAKRYYLYWILAGLEPSFGGIGYIWIKTVLKLTAV